MAKEAEVDELRRRISQRLEENELQRKKEAQLHQEEMDNSTAKNQGIENSNSPELNSNSENSIQIHKN